MRKRDGVSVESGVAWAIVAILLTIALQRLAPAAARDLLAGTALALPPVGLLLWRAWSLSGSSWSGGAQARALAAVALVVLAAAAPGLGLRWGTALVSPMLVAGLLIITFWQAVETLRALAARADALEPRRRADALLLTTFAVYLAIIPWTSSARPPDGDEPYYLLIAHSLAYDFDVDLADNYERGDSLSFMPRRIGPQPGDPKGPEGQRYSRHNMALPLLLAIPYRLGSAPAVFMTMALLTALLVERTMRLANLYFPEQTTEVLMACAILGLAPPLLLYAHQVWSDVPAALILAWGWEGVLRARRRQGGVGSYLVVAVACALLPIVKLRFLAVAGSLVLVALVGASGRQRKLLVRGGIGLLALLTAILLFNARFFGNPLKYHGPQLILTYLAEPVDYLAAPVGLPLDAGFGLLLISPFWLLLTPAVFDLWRRHRTLLMHAALLVGPYLLLLAPRSEWYGGWSPPFRYAVVFLPVMAVCMVPLFQRRGEQGTRLLLGLLLAATAILTLVGLVLPGWTVNFGDGRSHLLDHLTRTFDADVARFFPSVVRPRAATWIWAVVVLPLLATVALVLRRPATRQTSTLGVVLFLALLACLPLAATRLPPAVIEFEDPWVEHEGGRLYPDQWVPGRVQFEGAWMLEGGAAVSVELQPRGTLLRLSIDYRPLLPAENDRLEILVGDIEARSVPLPPARGWNTLIVDDIVWPPGASRLTIRLQAAGAGRVLLDRCRVAWR